MKLFISYSRDDKHWVYGLWRELLNEGHYPWIDRDIPATADWWGTICQNIEDCECFIYVMTPKSVTSIYCLGEMRYALALNKPILPVMLKQADYPKELSDSRIQFQLISDDMSMDKVLFRIEKGLREAAVAIAKGNYEPQDAKRPEVPKPQQDPEHVYEVYVMAAEAAASGNIAQAQIFFAQVVAADPDGLGEAAKERMAEILLEQDRGKAYVNVKRLADNPAMLKDAQAVWRAFKRKYPDYDPDALAAKLDGTKPPEKVQPEVPKQQTVTQPQPEAPKQQTVMQPTRRSIFDILPAPFDMITIPRGKVTVKGTSETITEFEIAKYPVTNAQFAQFIAAKGYENREWWTEVGWIAREQGWYYDKGLKSSGKMWSEPRYWHHKRWNGDLQPVVGVSWYEALAFCLWLSAETGDTIILPTEQQWQRAAQGNDGRAYPWGNDWDCNRCNNRAEPCSSNGTTRVTHYAGKAKGGSYFGVVDMAGNVWEWCRTAYSNSHLHEDIDKADMRVVRGGSWSNSVTNVFRCADRSYIHPYLRGNDIGFRIARS